ncbi:MAG: hypothetical protein QOE23_1472, partial [Pseudonocardiales bacterium]|nr:hypothetical protein [Pseudonocardiales bacterium]
MRLRLFVAGCVGVVTAAGLLTGCGGSKGTSAAAASTLIVETSF